MDYSGTNTSYKINHIEEEELLTVKAVDNKTGKSVGFIDIGLEDPDIAYTEHVYVEADSEGKGIASSLYRASAEYIREYLTQKEIFAIVDDSKKRSIALHESIGGKNYGDTSPMHHFTALIEDIIKNTEKYAGIEIIGQSPSI